VWASSVAPLAPPILERKIIRNAVHMNVSVFRQNDIHFFRGCFFSSDFSNPSSSSSCSSSSSSSSSSLSFSHCSTVFTRLLILLPDPFSFRFPLALTTTSLRYFHNCKTWNTQVPRTTPLLSSNKRCVTFHEFQENNVKVKLTW